MTGNVFSVSAKGKGDGIPMNYVVVDLEWNQAMSSKSSVFNRLPIHLRGEIIQIGAVRLNEDMTPGEEFQIDVKPVYFKRMHYKVKKLTGFDKERLSHGVSFPEALEQFRAWCGEGVTFLTWGYDDQGIMEQNIIIHDLDWDWIAGWVNLQLIYNLQTGGDKNQKSLATAMEHFGIEQTRVAHDALGDAYNTGLVCSRLDMVSGMEQYADAVEILSHRGAPKEKKPRPDTPEPIAHSAFSGYASKGDAFADCSLAAPACPICGAEMQFSRDKPGRPEIHVPRRVPPGRQAAAEDKIQALRRWQLFRRPPRLPRGREHAELLRRQVLSAEEPGPRPTPRENF